MSSGAAATSDSEEVLEQKITLFTCAGGNSSSLRKALSNGITSCPNCRTIQTDLKLCRIPFEERKITTKQRKTVLSPPNCLHCPLIYLDGKLMEGGIDQLIDTIIQQEQEQQQKQQQQKTKQQKHKTQPQAQQQHKQDEGQLPQHQHQQDQEQGQPQEEFPHMKANRAQHEQQDNNNNHQDHNTLGKKQEPHQQRHSTSTTSTESSTSRDPTCVAKVQQQQPATVGSAAAPDPAYVAKLEQENYQLTRSMKLMQEEITQLKQQRTKQDAALQEQIRLYKALRGQNQELLYQVQQKDQLIDRLRAEIKELRQEMIVLVKRELLASSSVGKLSGPANSTKRPKMLGYKPKNKRQEKFQQQQRRSRTLSPMRNNNNNNSKQPRKFKSDDNYRRKAAAVVVAEYDDNKAAEPAAAARRSRSDHIIHNGYDNHQKANAAGSDRYGNNEQPLRSRSDHNYRHHHHQGAHTPTNNGITGDHHGSNNHKQPLRSRSDHNYYHHKATTSNAISSDHYDKFQEQGRRSRSDHLNTHDHHHRKAATAAVSNGYGDDNKQPLRSRSDHNYHNYHHHQRDHHDNDKQQPRKSSSDHDIYNDNKKKKQVTSVTDYFRDDDDLSPSTRHYLNSNSSTDDDDDSGDEEFVIGDSRSRRMEDQDRKQRRQLHSSSAAADGSSFRQDTNNKQDDEEGEGSPTSVMSSIPSTTSPSSNTLKNGINNMPKLYDNDKDNDKDDLKRERQQQEELRPSMGGSQEFRSSTSGRGSQQHQGFRSSTGGSQDGFRQSRGGSPTRRRSVAVSTSPIRRRQSIAIASCPPRSLSVSRGSLGISSAVLSSATEIDSQKRNSNNKQIKHHSELLQPRQQPGGGRTAGISNNRGVTTTARGTLNNAASRRVSMPASALALLFDDDGDDGNKYNSNSRTGNGEQDFRQLPGRSRSSTHKRSSLDERQLPARSKSTHRSSVGEVSARRSSLLIRNSDATVSSSSSLRNHRESSGSGSSNQYNKHLSEKQEEEDDEGLDGDTNHVVHGFEKALKASRRLSMPANRLSVIAALHADDTDDDDDDDDSSEGRQQPEERRRSTGVTPTRARGPTPTRRISIAISPPTSPTRSSVAQRSSSPTSPTGRNPLRSVVDLSSATGRISPSRRRSVALGSLDQHNDNQHRRRRGGSNHETVRSSRRVSGAELPRISVPDSLHKVTESDKEIDDDDDDAVSLHDDGDDDEENDDKDSNNSNDVNGDDDKFDAQKEARPRLNQKQNLSSRSLLSTSSSLMGTRSNSLPDFTELSDKPDDDDDESQPSSPQRPSWPVRGIQQNTSSTSTATMKRQNYRPSRSFSPMRASAPTRMRGGNKDLETEMHQQTTIMLLAQSKSTRSFRKNGLGSSTTNSRSVPKSLDTIQASNVTNRTRTTSGETCDSDNDDDAAATSSANNRNARWNVERSSSFKQSSRNLQRSSSFKQSSRGLNRSSSFRQSVNSSSSFRMSTSNSRGDRMLQMRAEFSSQRSLGSVSSITASKKSHMGESEQDEDDPYVQLPLGNYISVQEATEELKRILPIKNMKYNRTTYRKSFKGSSVADTFQEVYQYSRKDAEELGKALHKSKMLYHVCNAHGYRDNGWFYRLQCHHTPAVLNSYCVWKDSVTQLLSCSEVVDDVMKQLQGVLDSVRDSKTGRIDYARAAAEDEFKEALLELDYNVCQFQMVQLARLDKKELFAFGLNVFQIFLHYGFLKLGIPSSKDSSAHSDFWTELKFNVGGDLYSFHDWWNGICRGNRKGPHGSKPFSGKDTRRFLKLPDDVDPRIHFVPFMSLVKGKMFVYTSWKFNRELDDAAKAFCRNGDFITIRQAECSISLSSIFHLYLTDFAPTMAELPKALSRWMPRNNKEYVDEIVAMEKQPKIEFKGNVKCDNWEQFAGGHTIFKECPQADFKTVISLSTMGADLGITTALSRGLSAVLSVSDGFTGMQQGAQDFEAPEEVGGSFHHRTQSISALSLGSCSGSSTDLN